MRELPEPDIISEVKDFACPACHAHLGYQSPIRIGYRRDQVLAIQQQAYEDGLRDAAEKIEAYDCWLPTDTTANVIREMLTASQEKK